MGPGLAEMNNGCTVLDKKLCPDPLEALKPFILLGFGAFWALEAPEPGGSQDLGVGNNAKTTYFTRDSWSHFIKVTRPLRGLEATKLATTTFLRQGALAAWWHPLNGGPADSFFFF